MFTYFRDIGGDDEINMDVDPNRVIKLVKRPRWAQHLLTHVRNERIVNTSGGYYHLDQQGKYRILSGLLPRLRATYWPHSSYIQLMKRTKKESIHKAEPGGQGRFGGLIRGSRVHKQLQDFIRLDREHFLKCHKRLHAYTARLLNAIVNNLKLQPFLPEFDLYDEELHIGTSVDHIGLDQEGHLALLEFKTGYKNCYTGNDGFMQGSLRLMPCTPQNQATLQLVASALILNRRYQIPLEEMRLYVMRCDDTVVEMNPVPTEFVTKLSQTMYNDLLATVSK